jgi:hypothetical protein
MGNQKDLCSLLHDNYYMPLPPALLSLFYTIQTQKPTSEKEEENAVQRTWCISLVYLLTKNNTTTKVQNPTKSKKSQKS